MGLLAPQDPEMGSLENACCVLGRSVEEVLVLEGWDHDGLVFPLFLEAVQTGLEGNWGGSFGEVTKAHATSLKFKQRNVGTLLKL